MPRPPSPAAGRLRAAAEALQRLALLLALLLAPSPPAAQTAPARIPASPGPTRPILTAETGSPGTVPYLALASLGEFAAEEGIADFTLRDGRTMTDGLMNLVEGRADVISAPFILPFLMSRGAGPYAGLGAEKGAALSARAAVLYTYRFGGMSLYAYDGAPVRGWEDLRGRRVLNGPPRGAALTNARTLIQLVTGLVEGKDYEGVQVEWNLAPKTIADGSADAMVLPVYFPDDRMIRAAAAGRMTLWSVPKAAWESEAMQRYLRSPGTGAFVMDLAGFQPPEGISVVSEDGIWRSPATTGGELVRADMDFETARALTAAFLARLPRVLARAPAMARSAFGETDPAVTGMCGANPLKYHPGAVEAWRQAGYALPACATP